MNGIKVKDLSSPIPDILKEDNLLGDPRATDKKRENVRALLSVQGAVVGQVGYRPGWALHHSSASEGAAYVSIPIFKCEISKWDDHEAGN